MSVPIFSNAFQSSRVRQNVRKVWFLTCSLLYPSQVIASVDDRLIAHFRLVARPAMHRFCASASRASGFLPLGLAVFRRAARARVPIPAKTTICSGVFRPSVPAENDHLFRTIPTSSSRSVATLCCLFLRVPFVSQA
jgi:hypothetical protein